MEISTLLDLAIGEVDGPGMPDKYFIELYGEADPSIKIMVEILAKHLNRVIDERL